MTEKISISISSKGYYYLRSIIGSFEYLDMVLQDTPIYDKTTFGELKSVFPLSMDSTGKRDIERRISCVTKFLEYIEQMEKELPPGFVKKYGKVTGHLLDHGLKADLRELQVALDKRPYTPPR